MFCITSPSVLINPYEVMPTAFFALNTIAVISSVSGTVIAGIALVSSINSAGFSHPIELYFVGIKQYPSVLYSPYKLFFTTGIHLSAITYLLFMPCAAYVVASGNPI